MIHLQTHHQINTERITANGPDPDLPVASIAQKRCTDILGQDQGLLNANTKINRDPGLHLDLVERKTALQYTTSRDTEKCGKMGKTVGQG